jgi:hypothetical protein
VSRVYLRKDQLINESIEVEPLKYGERIACDEENNLELPMSASASRRTSFIPQNTEHQPVEEDEEMMASPVETELKPISQPIVEQEERELPTTTEQEVMKVDVQDIEQDKPSEPTLEIPNQDEEEQEEEEEEEEAKEEQQQQEDSSSDSDDDEGGLDEVDVPLADVERDQDVSDSNVSKQTKSRLSPSAPEFVPRDDKWTPDTDSETWNGYPVPEEEDEEVWKGYPGPNSSTDSPRRTSSQSETSEEWKGYHATKMEATWQRESALKVQQHEWQGYTLETLDEDELDSSTMMDGEFEKSRQARGQQGDDLFQRVSKKCA